MNQTKDSVFLNNANDEIVCCIHAFDKVYHSKIYWFLTVFFSRSFIVEHGVYLIGLLMLSVQHFLIFLFG